MKEILLQYATFNAWANQRLCETVLLLPELQQEQHIDSSFPSLKKTLAHMWDAESIWWQRMKLLENVTRPSESGEFSTQEISTNLVQQNKNWLDWINNATPAAIDHVFAYQNTKREQFKQPIYQMLMHVFNHGTYHRGQLVTMLRQLGIDKIPATDYIVWSRRK